MLSVSPEHNFLNQILGVIPARGGSKRILNKNLQNLNGVPLIDHTIDFANRLSIKNCYVSSDNDEIRRRVWGNVTAPFRRPAEASRDESTDLEWLLHAIDFHNNHSDDAVSHVLILRPTSPIRDFKKALEVIELGLKNNKSVRSVKKIPTKMCPSWAIKKSDSGFSTLFPDGFLTRSQDIEDFYYPTGVYDLVHVETFLRTKKMYGENFMIVNDEHSFPNDIDTYEDLEFFQKNFDTLTTL